VLCIHAQRGKVFEESALAAKKNRNCECLSPARREFWEGPMEWLDDLAAALPAPREDEPPELRRRIVAELRDHLHAAFQRELLLTPDAVQAQRNVLARFGDPVRLARKLWFEAMWEKIMSQRLMLAAMAVVVLVSVGSMGLTWFVIVQAGQVNQALLEQNRAANEALLAKLATLGNTDGKHEKTMEWNSLKVRLVFEKSGGAPAAGVQTALQGQILAAGSATGMVRTTGADGVADFGLVRPGQYLLDFQMPWGESIESSQSGLGISIGFSGQLVTVLPGEPQTLEIVCPSKPQETEIGLAVDWPDDLARRRLWLVCDLVRSPRKVGGQTWSQSSENASSYVVVDPSGQLASPDMQPFGDGSRRGSISIFDEEGQKRFWQEEELRTYVGASKSFVDAPGIYHYLTPDSRGNVGWHNEKVPARIWLPKTGVAPRLMLPSGTYTVKHVAIGGDSDTAEESLPDDVLHPIFLGGVTIGTTDEGGIQLLYPDEPLAQARRRQRGKPKTEIPRFEAAGGRVNEWRLSLPEPLVDLLRTPRPKADVEAASRSLNWPQPAVSGPRAARRVAANTELDTLPDLDLPANPPLPDQQAQPLTEIEADPPLDNLHPGRQE
jgi:hypothetical protein